MFIAEFGRSPLWALSLLIEEISFGRSGLVTPAKRLMFAKSAVLTLHYEGKMGSHDQDLPSWEMIIVFNHLGVVNGGAGVEITPTNCQVLFCFDSVPDLVESKAVYHKYNIYPTFLLFSDFISHLFPSAPLSVLNQETLQIHFQSHRRSVVALHVRLLPSRI